MLKGTDGIGNDLSLCVAQIGEIMQKYRNQKVVDALMGKRDALEEQGKADVASGKADRFVIGELPYKGMTVTLNDLRYTVFSITGGTVVLKLQNGKGIRP
ncbi:MAG: hypothetical protein CVU71_03805 [Deltaproteobacteria bacterium HGW-Deltaproteobacteria-6]|jgi:hypothetical protein|nr:MAG: hypothetical protein CVU71_03805 [Deltaproteobacteria bacterium HGW-Deltaproteobacteria-6]